MVGPVAAVVLAYTTEGVARQVRDSVGGRPTKCNPSRSVRAVDGAKAGRCDRRCAAAGHVRVLEQRVYRQHQQREDHEGNGPTKQHLGGNRLSWFAETALRSSKTSEGTPRGGFLSPRGLRKPGRPGKHHLWRYHWGTE